MNQQDAVLAGRYAKAYLEASQAAKALAAAREDLENFAGKLRADAAFADAMKHPLLPPAEKKKIMAKAVGKHSATFEKFFELLLAKKRLNLAQAIAAHFVKLSDEAAGRARLKVTSAAPFGKSETEKLAHRLGKILKKEVSLDVAHDSALIGGLVLQSGDRVWDMSLKGRLESLAEQLASEHKN